MTITQTEALARTLAFSIANLLQEGIGGDWNGTRIPSLLREVEDELLERIDEERGSDK